MFEEKSAVLRPWYAPPLGLLTIAARTPPGIEQELIDEDFENIDFGRDYDLVAISAMTQQVDRAYEIAQACRERGIPVVLGGSHASVLPSEAGRYVDTVVVGEAEELWPEFLRDLDSGHPQPLYANPEGYGLDLRKSPVPRYDLVPPEHISKGDGYFNMVPVQATRGCPHDCSFCSVSHIYGRTIRKKSVEQVLEEVKTVKKLFGSRLIGFADDNLLVDKRYARALLQGLLPLKMLWFGQADASIGRDRALLELAYRSGCLMMLMGLESLSLASLRTVNHNHWKMKRLETYAELVRSVQENGIIAFPAFIVGFDTDTPSTFDAIDAFMRMNRCPGQITVLTPLPGTRLYRDWEAAGRLPDGRFWDKCSFFDPLVKPAGMSIEEVVCGLVRIYTNLFGASAVTDRYQYMKSIYRRLPSRWSLACSTQTHERIRHEHGGQDTSTAGNGPRRAGRAGA